MSDAAGHSQLVPHEVQSNAIGPFRKRLSKKTPWTDSQVVNPPLRRLSQKTTAVQFKQKTAVVQFKRVTKWQRMTETERQARNRKRQGTRSAESKKRARHDRSVEIRNRGSNAARHNQFVQGRHCKQDRMIAE